MFGGCKTFSGKYVFSGNANFRKRKMFPCVWLHFKKFSGKNFLVFGKEEGKHKSRKPKPQPRKKSTMIAIRDRDLAGAISRRRDRDQRRDLATARSRSTSRSRDGAIAISIRRDRDLDQSRSRIREIALSIAILIRRHFLISLVCSFSRSRVVFSVFSLPLSAFCETRK